MEAKKAKKEALHDVSSFGEQVATAGMPVVELLSNGSPVSGQMAGATAQLRQARNMSLTQSKELAVFAQLKLCMYILEDNVVFYEANKEELQNELAAAINESTQFIQLADDIRVEVVDFCERRSVMAGVIRSILED